MSRWVTGVTIVTLIIMASSTSWAEQSAAQRAQAHINTGQAAFEEERYEVALREFRQARDLLDEPMITYNIAVSLERLGQLRDAIDEFNRYLRIAPEADNADDVRERIEGLHRRRVEEQDAGVEVEAADDAALIHDRDTQREARRFSAARHELDLLLGTIVTFAPGVRENPGSASFDLVFGYYFRINPTWHIGASFLYDKFFKGENVSNTSDQSNYGGAINGRWSRRYLGDRFEIRAEVGVGYQYMDERISYGAHWIFSHGGASIAYAFWGGFGATFAIDIRLGGIAGGNNSTIAGTDTNLDRQRFGGTIGFDLGLFWAF